MMMLTVTTLSRSTCIATIQLVPRTQEPTGWISNMLKLVEARGGPWMYPEAPHKPQTADHN